MSDDPLLSRQLANFRLERVIGRGGMAQIYYGWDVKLQRPVAVKVIDARFRGNPAYAKRFVHEAQAVAAWRHENIAQIHYADEEDDLYYFVMEYIDGLDLGQVLTEHAAQNKLVPQADVLRIGRSVASALDYAHSKNVIHRDVKPSNVMVANDGRVVLTDFGLALDVQQGSVGEVFGTAHYISPEQARRSSDAVPQSDIYSLGVMLYEMLTGVVPFDDPSPTSVAIQHITKPPPAPTSINPALNLETEAVLLKALSKSPHERYQTGAALTTALEAALKSSGVVTDPQPRPVSSAQVALPVTAPAPVVTSSPKQSPSHLPLWAAFTGCALFAVVGIILVGIFSASSLGHLFRANMLSVEVTATPSPVRPLASPRNSLATEIPPTALPSKLVNTPAPTVKYPNGKHFTIFYNENSLYLLNLSKSVIAINWVAFERLSDAGVAQNRFNGSRWGQFYANSEPGWCVAVNILDSSPYLNPPECGHANKYLSLRTPTRDDPTIFWTTQPGSHQFRVLWREGAQDNEVARCDIGANTCEVFFP